MDGIHQLRVLVADQRADRLALLAQLVTGLGHEVVAHEVDVAGLAAATARERPDVALVALGKSTGHALAEVSEIVMEAFCPVIALLDSSDGDWANQAALGGVFASIVDSRPEELQSAIDVTLHRFGEYQHLQGAFERRNAETLRETERTRVQQRHVAERSQLETRLRHAEKLEALGQLAGGVAHDFNNLLVAIRGYGELALGRLQRGEEGAAEDVEGVLVAADRAAVLTRQLLAFGRRQVLNPEVLDLNEVVRETNALLEQLIGDNVELLSTVAEQPVVVKADRGQLEQVITNLAVNARDAMPRGGVLTIQVTTADLDPTDGGGAPRHALLSVTDEGSGIDPATASRIFEPFFTTKGEGGTGLGLATVYGIVAQSGGQVVLETEAGRGSTFSVYLPLSAEELSPARLPPASRGENGTETILLVEDDAAVRSIVSTMLSARGYVIVDAADGEEAIMRFESRVRPIELVVSDLVMLGLDGREAIARIRQIEPATKVLYMSGYTGDAIIRSGGLTAGTGFIQKPFSGDELAASIRELLDGVAA
jgi:two-component system cell cycle sensor histidine kinase/response regulator CckA